MGIEYKIRFTVPAGYDPAALSRKLPEPAGRDAMAQIYCYFIEDDGFFFVDHLVDAQVAALALRVLIDEALRFSGSVEELTRAGLATARRSQPSALRKSVQWQTWT